MSPLAALHRITLTWR